mmetsp:Transcript_50687/g.110584  ORF Transcript_50687/g.110584 Transcript_50687/m.110584 type:complete len:241 (+) Transcript_50687:1919-2641(+)
MARDVHHLCNGAIGEYRLSLTVELLLQGTAELCEHLREDLEGQLEERMILQIFSKLEGRQFSIQDGRDEAGVISDRRLTCHLVVRVAHDPHQKLCRNRFCLEKNPQLTPLSTPLVVDLSYLMQCPGQNGQSGANHQHGDNEKNDAHHHLYPAVWLDHRRCWWQKNPGKGVGVLHIATTVSDKENVNPAPSTIAFRNCLTQAKPDARQDMRHHSDGQQHPSHCKGQDKPLPSHGDDQVLDQ